jgi:FMN phosphatase YigB (HAD superfamily)
MLRHRTQRRRCNHGGQTRRRASRITHIYFDWSGTLAKRGMRAEFIYGPLAEKRSVLYADTLDVLQILASRGYTLGILTNTSHDPVAFKAALKAAGLMAYLRGAIVTNNDATGLCRKPCGPIFRAALTADKVRPSAALMVGDKCDKDIAGAARAGMHTFHKGPRTRLRALLNSIPKLL